MRTTIKLTEKTKERLRIFKNLRSNELKKDLTYNDAVEELLSRWYIPDVEKLREITK